MPSNEDIKDYKFDIPEIDNMERFDYCARGELIERKISVKDYLIIEKALSSVRIALEEIETKYAKSILRECVEGY